MTYCEYCGAVASARRCEGCGGPTRTAQIEPRASIPPALAEVLLLRLSAIEAHAESTAAMARALRAIVQTISEDPGAPAVGVGTDGTSLPAGRSLGAPR